MDLHLSNVFNLESVKVIFIKSYCIKLYIYNRVIEFQIYKGSAVIVMNIKDYIFLNQGV